MYIISSRVIDIVRLSTKSEDLNSVGCLVFVVYDIVHSIKLFKLSFVSTLTKRPTSIGNV